MEFPQQKHDISGICGLLFAETSYDEGLTVHPNKFPRCYGVFHGGLMEALVTSREGNRRSGETKKEHFKALPKRFQLFWVVVSNIFYFHPNLGK